ncbi:class I SAM-dependent methyltransferase [Desulfurivibrio sp. D14AmB]|uniref:class I SAM-dependent methyltransferase n=1 Tax=Desulfurivibrio sp. D14AmB TaxID=3374370 RepID=UPI00376F238A
MISQTTTAVPGLAVAAATPELAEPARELASRLGLVLVENPYPEQLSALLLLTEQRLELRQLAAGAPGPVYVELIGETMGYRLRHGGGKQALARAVGLKGQSRPTVIDATAGLGRDAFILADLGCRVHMIERSPAIHALLADGLKRAAAADPAIATMINQRIRLLLGNAIDLLAQRSFPAAEVIYLDPMFPGREKSALVKKEMRLLRLVAGEDLDAELLLARALTRAQSRVVVKRPRLAPPLSGPVPPNYSLAGKSSRFDIYLVRPADHSG